MGYEYKAWPVAQVVAIIRQDKCEGFVSKDKCSERIAEAIDQGYRWVRTECEMAIFEKEKSSDSYVLTESATFTGGD
jgi:hypothetical protein